MTTIQDIYYINHLNQRINLMESPYYLQTGDFLNYKWDYSGISNSHGGRVISFERGLSEYELTLSVMSGTKEAYHAALNNLHNYTESDVLAMIPGRLYIGNQYLICYIIESEKTEWEMDEPMLDVTVKLLSENPFWVTETEYYFDYAAVPSGSSYPYGYDYGYPNELSNGELLNEDISDSNFRLLVYGPATNPEVYVNGHTYEVTATLSAGEYLEIDSVNKTIYQVATDGTKTNMFNYRNKAYSIFKKIPAGRNVITWPETFSFSFILIEERSEPKWI